MPFKTFKILTYLFLTFSLFPLELVAQYAPYFKNYPLSEYNAGNQNWDVSKAENGKLYVANNNGLLEYDGLKWDFYELPNKTIIRSVLAYKDLIYTGSYEEFGYWKKNSKGELVYHSLSDSIKSQISSNEEIWQILPFKDAIVFRSFINIYILKNEEIIKIKPLSTVISCDVIKNNLYVSTLKNGVYILENDKLTAIINGRFLNDMKVVSISELKGSLFITTSLNGCFIYSNNNLKPYNSEINELVKQHQLNHFSVLQNGNMVFGTIKDGVYLTKDNGEIIFHVNKENGLINNTVLGQFVDENQTLWLGLDNGIASIDLSSHNYFFNDISGKLGAVYDVIKFKDVIYLASNTGLFYLDEDNKLQFIKGSQSQVWSLKEIDGELFCCHNYGTFLVKDKQLIPVCDYTGGWELKKVPEHNNIYIEGAYTGLVRFKKNGSNWEVKHLGETTMPIKFLAFEDQNTAWAAHAYKGLYKIKFDKNYDTIISIENYNKKGVFSDFNVRVYKIKNDICFKTNNGWMKYEPIIDSIIPNELLNETFGKDSYLISEDNVDQLVLKNSNDLISFKPLSNDEKDISLPSNFIKNRLNVGNENVSRISDSTYALNLNNGFMLIDKRTNNKVFLNKPQIEKIQVDKSLIDLNNSEAVEFPYKKSISISLSSAKSDNHYFEYSISNFDSIHWNKLEKDKLELTNLNSGDYTILFRTSNSFGDKSESVSKKIHVLPPWYKNRYGFALYSFITLLTIYIFYVLHKRKIDKEQKLLQLKFETEQKEILKEKTLENDRKIVELKNEALKNEVKLKSKQLANTAMALVKKNETLMELKNELVQHKNGFDNYYSYKNILKKVDNSIAHKDEWKIFEYNFNQVHEEFFNQLKKQFPELTPKDLKICAYIKMNLSTKEIAPLLNISVRGVETHRYRLKRKLNLDNDISLGLYLRNFT